MSLKRYAAAFAVVLFIGTLLSVYSQSTVFNYQGSLKVSGVPPTGIYDFEFALFDAVNAGTQLGATATRNGMIVADGIFAVSLDFGNQFTGAGRFLEIRVRASPHRCPAANEPGAPTGYVSWMAIQHEESNDRHGPAAPARTHP